MLPHSFTLCAAPLGLGKTYSFLEEIPWEFWTARSCW